MSIILTEEQRKIAEENHKLIYFFINFFKVDVEEYYDLFAIDYLKCIKVWDKSKGSLSALLGRAFSNRIKAENRKKRAKKRFEECYTISLNEVVFRENSDLSLEDMIASSTNVEETFELNEALNFFMQNEVTKLLIIGYSQKEIAEKLNYAQPTISKKVSRLKKKFNNKILKT